MQLKLVQSALAAAAGCGLQPAASADLQRAAARDALQVIEQALPQFKRMAGGH